jgi:hypothetical protein
MSFNKAQREAVVASILLSLAGFAFAKLTSTTDKNIFFISAIYMAAFLYFVRLKWRFMYGIMEIIFGVYVIYYAFEPTHNSISRQDDLLNQPLMFIQVAAAIYILIRGFDNTFQGLPKELQEKTEATIKAWHI